ncbi:hypothetical protein [Streptomyces sp. NBC_01171]|uniref:hypothetical protein n=1 Tax=Streptomyces sp. NBC_01171 TaxID=2903757 RepID=UPI00386CCB4B|nr:hypothetical protein OG448_15110 [Streptomyces sp. NBC_01171]
MRHLTTALTTAYALTAAALIHSGLTAAQQGAPGHAALCAATAILLGLGIVHHAYHRDQLRTALAHLERAIRPTGPSEQQLADEAALGWHALAMSCCLTGLMSGGVDHETTCTRKDHHA